MKFPAALVAGLGLSLVFLCAPVLAQETAAPDLARRLGCFACHEPGPGQRAQSLTGIGTRLSREQMQLALTQPRRLHPGAKMPSYAYLPAGERQALVDFLAALRQSAPSR